MKIVLQKYKHWVNQLKGKSQSSGNLSIKWSKTPTIAHLKSWTIDNIDTNNAHRNMQRS